MAIGTALSKKSMVAVSILGLVLLSLAGLVSYALFLFGGESLPSGIVRQVSAAIYRQYGISLQVGKVTPGPFGRVNLDGIKVNAPGDPDLLAVKRISVSIDPVAWVRGRFAPAAAVGEITLVQPSLTLRREAGGSWNLSRYVKPSGGRSSVFRGKVVVSDGSVKVYGLSPKDWGARSGNNDSAISLKSVSGSVSFSPTGSLRFLISGFSSLEPTARIEVSGRVAPSTGAGSPIAAMVKLRDLDLAKAVRYLPASINVGSVTSGRANVTLNISRANSESPVKTEGEASFSQVDWASPWLPGRVRSALGSVRFTPDRLTVNELSADFLGTRFRVAGRVIGLSNPVLDLSVKADNADLSGLSGLIAKMSDGFKASGHVDVDAVVKGPWRDPLVTGRAKFAGGYLNLPGIDRPLTDVNGEISVKGRTLRTDGLVAKYAGSQATIRGALTASKDPTADLSISVMGFPVEEAVRLGAPRAALPPVSGNLALKADIKGPLSAPVVRGSLGLSGGRYDDLEVKEAEAKFAYASGNLAVTRFKASLDSGALTGAITANGVRSALPSYAFELNVDSLDIAKTLSDIHVRTSTPLSGKASVALTGQGRGWGRENLVATVTAKVSDGAIAAQPFNHLFAGLAWERGDLVVDSLSLESASGSIAARGSVAADGRVSGSVSGDDLKIGELVKNLNLARYWPEVEKLGVSGTADVAAQLGGSVSQPSVTGDLQVEDPSFRGSRFRFAEGKFALAESRLKLEDFAVRQGETEHRLSGEIRLGKETALDLHLESQSASVAQLLNLGGIKADATGTLDGTFDVSGTLSAPVVQGKANVARGSIVGQPFDRAEAAFTFSGGNLALERLSAQAGETTLTGRGEMKGGQLDLFVNADHIDLATVAALKRAKINVAGLASFRGTVKGAPEDPILEGEIRGSNLAYADYQVNSLEGSVRATKARLTLANVAVHRGSERYVVSGEVDYKQHLTLDLRARLDKGDIPELLRLAKVRLPYEVSGGLTGVLRVWGEPKNPSARLMAETSDARFGGMELSGDADVGLRDGEVIVNRLRLSQGDGLVVAMGKIGRDRAMDFKAHGQGLAIGPWLEALKLPVALEGTAEADVTLAGTLANPQARATVRVVNGKMNGAAVDTMTGTAVLSGPKVTLENVVVASGKHSLTVTGDMPLPKAAESVLAAARTPGRYDLSVRMDDGDFALLNFLAPSLTMSGPGVVNLRVSGPTNAVTVTGEVVAKGVTISHPSLLGSISNLNGKMEFRGDHAELDDVTGDYNGGSVSGKGNVRWVNNAPDLDLVVSGKNVHYPDPLFDTVVTTNNLSVKGPLWTPTVEGRATLEKATLTLGATRKKGTGSRFNPNLNISVSSREDVRVATRDKSLDVRAYGSLSIRGSLRAPLFTGEAEATRGSIKYLDTQFQITRGTADFAAYRGILPRLDATAEANVDSEDGPVKVTLSVTGVVGQLALNLDSDPPMSQAEINGLLSLPGQISRLVASDRGNGTLQSEVARFVDTQLSNQVMGGLQNAVADALQLDEFKLGTSFSEQNLHVQIGKYLVDNLYMTYSRTFSTDPLETLRFEYRLQPGLLVNTSFDNRGEVRMGVEAKHRF